MSKITVWCTLDVVGFHCWPEAPIETLRYLRLKHRHVFKFKVGVLVSEKNRQVEFHTLKAECFDVLSEIFYVLPEGTSAQPLYNFDDKACEHIATALGEGLVKNTGHVLRFVEVSEDGENGAIVEW